MIGGKAFATYTNAKRIVKLVNDVGSVVNNDPDVNEYLKVWKSPNNCNLLLNHENYFITRYFLSSILKQ